MIHFNNFYYKNQEFFIKEVKEDLNKFLLDENEIASIGIPPRFVARLLNYLESKCFVSFGDFDTAIGNEIRQYMKGDNSYVKKVKQRIHEIINKARNRFLRDVNIKVEKIKVQPRSKPKSSPLHFDPLMSDEPTVGDTPTNVN